MPISSTMQQRAQPTEPSGTRVKAQWLRSYVSILVANGKRDAVIALVPSATAALLRDPPLAASWIDMRHITEITVAVEKVGGLQAVRDNGRKVVEQSRKPYMAVMEGLLRLFGTSPATLFKRMGSLVSVFVDGISFKYTATTERSGIFEVQYAGDADVPLCVFVGHLAAYQLCLDVCGVKGAVGDPEMIGPSQARYHVHWV
jgi:hypothetical protein